MQAIELPVEIDANQQIHLQLPANIRAGKAKVIVMFEEPAAAGQPVTPGLFAGKLAMSEDFDAPLPDDFWLGESSQ